ncbi:hexaprenyldihydroxybenzoate methyltransferase mitochondrial precursor [Metschnikowia bicuspidata var. bicuspidata NRRL YB-4993]|uniref:Ubiquinone biosynthesis O-methyltransferase, mitochondrial n=1 Tax=Metschnikowia bicuspidata var. bicuspidata NRRL YB-4993 TaxID=869754 RepID=A0A1A0HIE1_9ASCO|nr:hexaprenyldihydroxybenzoate methyltransferase mitochondrial precursor [Metschnikowia bicuspidata var. bicuspidata NRRL YB-4993]OBA23652.1 hexaprenyldihydroxybenzoate methyltransferase mitochondrial precursor [Metschnikowia bicuspidata var. bicuspidata NRRL YB-4993]
MIKQALQRTRPVILCRAFSISCSLRHEVNKATSASKDEVTHFNALASSWWDVDGPQRILHKMNLLRMDYINEVIKNNVKLNADTTSADEEVYIAPYNLDLLPKSIKDRILEEQDEKRAEIFAEKPLKVLDVGCGGGILSESLARLNYVDSVKGIDLSADVLEAAKVHMKKDPDLTDVLLYEYQAVEELPKGERFDIITVFEMLEHVSYPAQILSEVFDRLETGGFVFLSTINRDFVSWFTTIFMGEHVLGIVPVGTHSVKKYINESEIRQWLHSSEYKKNFKIVDSRGCVYLPACGWKFTSNAEMGNYFMAIQKIG